MAPTTTFLDIKMTEDFENYSFERETYDLKQGDKVSMPKHTALKFVNKWNVAEIEGKPYEIRDDEYDDVVMTKEEGVEFCEVEKSDGEVCGREKPCPYHDE